MLHYPFADRIGPLNFSEPFI